MTYAYVKADQVVQILNPSMAWTDPATEIQHPSSIFSIWSKTDLANIGLYPLVSATPPASDFHTMGASSYAFDSVKKEVVESIASSDKKLDDTLYVDGDDIPDDKKVGDVASQGLVNLWIEKTKNTASSLLTPTDWYIIRNTEDNTKSIPSAVTTHRASVRTACNEIETKIKECDTLDKLKTLFVIPTDSENKVTGNAPIYDFPKPYGE